MEAAAPTNKLIRNVLEFQWKNTGKYVNNTNTWQLFFFSHPETELKLHDNYYFRATIFYGFNIHHTVKIYYN